MAIHFTGGPLAEGQESIAVRHSCSHDISHGGGDPRLLPATRIADRR